MKTLRGTGIGVGSVLGQAVMLQSRGGLVVAPGPLPVEGSRHHSSETPDVVLVTADYATAHVVADMVTWARVVGIAAVAGEQGSVTPDRPAVVGMPGLLDAVQDGALIYVDANRGIVSIDPDTATIASFQAEIDHLAPRQRIFLDGSHMPAVTMDGRHVLVLALAENEMDLEAGMEEGADALVVRSGSALLPGAEDEATFRRRLMAVAHTVSGKPLMILDDYSLPPMALLEAATHADVTVAAPLRPDLPGCGLAELAAELNEAQAECLASDLVVTIPRLAALLGGQEAFSYLAPPNPGAAEAWSASGAARVVISPEDALAPDDLEQFCALCAGSMLPVLCGLPQIGEDGLAPLLGALLGAGVAGIIVAPSQTQAVKDSIRDLSYSECLEALMDERDRRAG